MPNSPASEPRPLHVLAPAREGGLESVVEMLSAGQGKRAHVAAVLTPDAAPDHPFVVALRARGIPVTEVVVPGRAYLAEYQALRALLRDVRPDVVHAHGYRADIIAGLAAHRAGVPLVSTVHGFLGGGTRNRLNEALQRQALRAAHAVIAVSRPLVARLEAAGVRRDRIHWIPNAYHASQPPLSRVAARAHLGMHTDGNTIGWVGRLSAEKGPDVMLHALALASPTWRLHVVGSGRDRESLMHTAESLGVTSRVVWHGSISRAGSLLAAFDAFVLSSRTEGTPIALLEAMAAGVPVIATRVGGVPDVVRDTEAALVPAEDPAAIAHALDQLLADPAAASARRDAALARVATEFGATPWLEAIDRVYATTIGLVNPGGSR